MKKLYLLLISKGVDINIKDKWNHLAIDYFSVKI